METQARAPALRLMTNAALIVGASCSVIAMFIIGSRQRSVLLMTMFLVFVLAPFIALGLLNARARAWSDKARAIVQNATILISLASALKYVSVVVWPVKAQPASTFLMVPIASWALFGVVAILATRASRKA